MEENINNSQVLIIDSIKESLNASGLGKFKLMLFGSRARNDNSNDSDIDIFILSDKKLLKEEKLGLKHNIYFLLHNKKLLTYPLDLIIKSQEEYDYEKSFIGTLSNVVEYEGIAL